MEDDEPIMDRRWGSPKQGGYQKAIRGKNMARAGNKFTDARPWLKETLEELDFGRDEG